MTILIGKKAPYFSTNAVINGNTVKKLSLQDFKNSYILIFFYPKDFTFVCPTELHAFQEYLNKFTEKNVKLLAISTDSVESHLAWLNISKNNGGIKGVTYPILSDINKTISYNYGVLSGNFKLLDNNILTVTSDNQELIAYRGLFLIDKKGIVRHQLINDFPLGRNVKEALRIVNALQHFERFGEVCPANWNYGDKAMKPNHQGVVDYMS